MPHRPDQVRIGQSTKGVLDNPESVKDWTDEELLHGRRAAVDGSFRGKPPAVVPHAVLMERNRRVHAQVFTELRESLIEGVKYVAAVNKGEQEPNRHRLHSIHMTMDRVFGKAPERVEITTHERPYQALMGKVYTDHDVMDADSWEGDFNDSPTHSSSSDVTAEMAALAQESLRKAQSIETTAQDEEASTAPTDLEPQEERSGLLRRKRKTVHRPPDARTDQRAHIRNARST